MGGKAPANTCARSRLTLTKPTPTPESVPIRSDAGPNQLPPSDRPRRAERFLSEACDYDTITKATLAVRDPLDDGHRFVAALSEHARLGIETVVLLPAAIDSAFTRRIGNELAGPPVADLGPPG